MKSRFSHLLPWAGVFCALGTFVVSITSNARTMVHREDGKAAAAGRVA
ncbi:MAG: hypothetical protein WB799_04535 [Candidatus Sulfotelmatobacter sp.]